MGQSLKIILSSFMIMAATPAVAVNWEGHENFFLEVVPVPTLTDGVAPPLPQQPLTCDERRKARAGNPYEQVAIPNVNCRDVELTPIN